MYHNADWWFSSPLIVGWGIVVIAIALWSIIWKGRALWKAARLGHMGWFIALLIINTAGILDILYIYVFSKPKNPSAGSGQAGPTNHAASMPPHHHDQTPMVQRPTDPTNPPTYGPHGQPHGAQKDNYHVGPAEQAKPSDQTS